MDLFYCSFLRQLFIITSTVAYPKGGVVWNWAGQASLGKRLMVLFKDQLFALWCFMLLACGFAGCDAGVRSIPVRPVMPDSSVLAADNDLFAAMPVLTMQLQLPSMEGGVDSFEYRLWCPKDADLINLIRIRYDEGKWLITETAVWSHIPEHGFRRGDTVNYLVQTIVDSFRTHVLTPRIAMQVFIDSLQYFNLQEAPSNAAITASASMDTDSWRYTFELADKVHYRIIEYNVGGVTDLKVFHQRVWGLLFFLKRQLKVEFRDPVDAYVE